MTRDARDNVRTIPVAWASRAPPMSATSKHENFRYPEMSYPFPPRRSIKQIARLSRALALLHLGQCCRSDCSRKTATATLAAVAHPLPVAITNSEELASLVTSLTPLLPAALRLTAVALRLFGLPASAMPGFASHLSDPAHVVSILNHVLAAQAIRLVSLVCHDKLLSPRPWHALAKDIVLETVSAQCQCLAKDAA